MAANLLESFQNKYGCPAGSTSAASGTTSASAIAQTDTPPLWKVSHEFQHIPDHADNLVENQDPTSPLDSSQFTSELVQFSSVEQQINTNTNLTQLIQLTQASQVEQSSALLNKPATVTSSQLSLQSGTSTINFNTTTAEPISISVVNASGTQVAGATATSTAGSNTWTWNGQTSSGAALPDGAYTVTVNTVGSSGTAAAVPVHRNRHGHRGGERRRRRSASDGRSDGALHRGPVGWKLSSHRRGPYAAARTFNQVIRPDAPAAIGARLSAHGMLTEPAAAFVTGCLPGVRTIPGQTTVHEALMTSCRASPR